MASSAARPKTYNAPQQHQPQPQQPAQPSQASARPGLGGHTSYYPKGYGISEGLKRARRPFVLPNLIVGSGVALIAVNLYFYSIYKVKQDDFSDIGITTGAQLQPLAGETRVPPAEAAPATNTSATASTTTNKHLV